MPGLDKEKIKTSKKIWVKTAHQSILNSKCVILMKTSVCLSKKSHKIEFHIYSTLQFSMLKGWRLNLFNLSTFLLNTKL